MTATQKARKLLARAFSPKDIASLTGLHEAYVRKIAQRVAGRDQAWYAWRLNNPAKEREYRDLQNRNRKLARASA